MLFSMDKFSGLLITLKLYLLCELIISLRKQLSILCVAYYEIVAFSYNIVSVSWAQTCPSYEVGYIGNGAIQTPETANVYINTQDVSPCAGTVYGWQYCSNPASTGDSNSSLQVQVSMYRSSDDGSSYHLVSGSLHSLIVEDNIDSYACQDRFLDRSEYFSVEQGDMVAACWNGTNRVELFGRRIPGPSKLAFGGECSQEEINDTSSSNRQTLFLSAYISKYKATHVYMAGNNRLCVANQIQYIYNWPLLHAVAHIIHLIEFIHTYLGCAYNIHRYR